MEIHALAQDLPSQLQADVSKHIGFVAESIYALVEMGFVQYPQSKTDQPNP
jgi:hypothetical protein